jgi:hypothetical protein
MTTTDQIMAAKAELKTLLSARRKRYMPCPISLIEELSPESQADVLRFHIEDIETANKKGRLRR